MFVVVWFFVFVCLLCHMNPGNGKRNVKKWEIVSKSCCLQSREGKTEACWGSDGWGSGVERIEKPSPCYGYLVHLDTQKETPITGTVSRYLPARNTFVKKKISLNNSGASLWMIQLLLSCIFKNKIQQKSQCLQEQQIGWILHTLIGIAPHSPLLIFFGIKQSLKDMATMTLKFKVLRSNTWSWRSLQLNYVTYLKAQAYYLRQYNSH